MEMLPVTPERKAELDDYAHRHGKDSATVLDEALGFFFGWERQDYQDSVEAIRRGYEDVKAGRTRPATEFVEELREKHDFPVNELSVPLLSPRVIRRSDFPCSGVQRWRGEISAMH